MGVLWLNRLLEREGVRRLKEGKRKSLEKVKRGMSTLKAT